MKRVEFVLSMPNNNAWNGKWTGESNHYAIKKNITNKTVKELFKDKAERSWHYNFGDGWTACVAARIVKPGEKLKKSNGFCGYSWMVDSIMLHDEIKTN